MKLIASTMCALTLAACSGNNSDDPNGSGNAREFQLRIENIAPWKLLKVSSQSTYVGTMIQGNLNPGQAYEVRFTAGPGHYLTFASSLIESNDLFFAPGDAAGIPLYVNGQRALGNITSAVRLWDAGTELNQELGVGDATCVNQPTRDYGAPDPDSRVRLLTQTDIGGWPIPEVSSMIRVTLTAGASADAFVLRIENVSTTTTLQNSVGTSGVIVSPVAWAISRLPNAFFDPGSAVRPNGFSTLAEAGLADPLTQALRYDRGIATSLGRGVFAVHRETGPLFYLDNADYGMGLEALAEDGDEQGLLANLKNDGRDGAVAGAFDTPVGATGATAAAPGQAFEFRFKAKLGDKLALATSFTASNDWFFGSSPEGIPLFLGDLPRWEDITPDIHLYDLGTEADEELDVGLDTGSQQTAPNTGRPDGKAVAREVTMDRYSTPVNQHVKVTLTPVDKL